MKRRYVALVALSLAGTLAFAYRSYFASDLVKELRQAEQGAVYCGHDLTFAAQNHLAYGTSEQDARRILVNSGFNLVWYGPGSPMPGRPASRTVQAERYASIFDFIKMYWIAVTFVDDKLVGIESYLKCQKL